MESRLRLNPENTPLSEEAKGKKKKLGRKAAKEKPSSMHDRSRLLGQGNETLRLEQTSDHATEKHKPQDCPGNGTDHISYETTIDRMYAVCPQ